MSIATGPQLVGEQVYIVVASAGQIGVLQYVLDDLFVLVEKELIGVLLVVFFSLQLLGVMVCLVLVHLTSSIIISLHFLKGQ